MDKEFVINLSIENSNYPLKIKRTDEEVYRRAAKEINIKLEQYKRQFTTGDPAGSQSKDYMAMTAIQAVVEKATYEMQAEHLEGGLKELTKELDAYLKANVR